MLSSVRVPIPAVEFVHLCSDLLLKVEVRVPNHNNPHDLICLILRIGSKKKKKGVTFHIFYLYTSFLPYTNYI